MNRWSGLQKTIFISYRLRNKTYKRNRDQPNTGEQDGQASSPSLHTDSQITSGRQQSKYHYLGVAGKSCEKDKEYENHCFTSRTVRKTKSAVNGRRGQSEVRKYQPISECRSKVVTLNRVLEIVFIKIVFPLWWTLREISGTDCCWNATFVSPWYFAPTDQSSP